jgi:HAD superfamily hydrolase (TIGR01509 family)
LERRFGLMFKCVISDLGKVILHFDNHIFFRKMARYCPYSARDIAGRVHWHKDLIEFFDSGKMEPQDFYHEVRLRLDAEIDQKTFFQIYSDIFSLDRPVLNILKKLKDRYRMVLLSNTDIERFGFVKRKFPEILIFDEYVLSFEVGCLKPNPEIYKAALTKAHARPGESVFIDDLKENIDGAAKMGIRAILFEPQTDLQAELKKMGISF